MAEPIEPTTRVPLIGDDDEDYELTQLLLDDVEQTHYELFRVNDFDAGLSELDSEKYDVCLLDNQLGARCGLELLKTRNSQIPIIMLTCIADRELDQAAMEAGASDFLVKSQLMPELIERAISYTSERHRLGDALEHLAKYDSLRSCKPFSVSRPPRRRG